MVHVIPPLLVYCIQTTRKFMCLACLQKAQTNTYTINKQAATTASLNITMAQKNNQPQQLRKQAAATMAQKMNSHNGLENEEKLNTKCPVLRTGNGGLKILLYTQYMYMSVVYTLHVHIYMYVHVCTYTVHIQYVPTQYMYTYTTCSYMYICTCT